jgi:hypothetical protein
MKMKRSVKRKSTRSAAKRSTISRPSNSTMAGIRLLSVTVLVTIAVIAIVVAASDTPTSEGTRTSDTTSRTSSAPAPIRSTSASRPATSSTKPVMTPAFEDGSDGEPQVEGTYVGCLRSDDEGQSFVLTEIGGPDAPKSRNWKTLFVTKKEGSLDVTSTGTVRLEPHVDQTVRLTGTRVGNDLVARSIRVVGSTCN